MTVHIAETAGSTTARTGGRLLVKIISPGQGSSGTYPPETLAAAAEAGVFARGTQMFVNHASPTEAYERPEGDLRNLAGVLTEDARLDADGALVAEARLYGHWAVIRDMAEDIGVSIRGNAEYREAGGQRIITRIAECTSIDFVTRAGRGGRILRVLESARPTRTQAVEALTGDLRQWIAAALIERNRRDGTERELVDFDDAVYIVHDWSAGTYHRQPYRLAGTVVTPVGEPAEVHRETVFHAVAGPPGSGLDAGGQTLLATETTPALTSTPTATPVPTPTPTATPAPTLTPPPTETTPTRESEAPVPTIEIDEADYQRLTTAEQRAAQLETELAEARRAERLAAAERILDEAFDGIDAPRHRARLAEAAAGAEEFDAEAFRTEALEETAPYRAAAPAARAAGAVTGLGDTTATTPGTAAPTAGDVLKIMKQEA
ncbi:hypothetical protein NBM05_08395 [Rothia sp. AR01]|uniref:Uncharacterized protein n=1 Tax=Rothia santali TaxID=2949643 RepID=A0A9X2HDB2_9MICC|nr:hypothetical protein [Rothia santali]MCP3426020.1 hypothetical protein [Rothia santali]